MHKPFDKLYSIKKWFFLAGVFSFFGYSCTKDTSVKNVSYHVTCTIDGTSMSFNARSYAHIEYGSGEKSLTIGGYADSSGNAGVIGFIIINDPGLDSITTGTYTDTSAAFTVLAAYQPTITDNGYEAGSSFYTEASNAGVIPANHFKAVITSLTPETVKGTFSGDFYYYGDPSGAKKTIANGDFYVKIQ